METRSKKRVRKSAEKRQSKCSRTVSPDKPIVSTTQVTALNHECLTEIFDYLDLQDLVNVAIANEHLRPAAAEMHKQKYGKKPVQIHRCDEKHPTDNSEVKELDTSIRLLGLKPALQYLRCFGSTITDLTISYNHSYSKRYDYVHQYINDYCTEHLTCILFSDMPNIDAKPLQKVFPNVHEVSVWDSDLGKQFPSFVNCFPNLRCLQLHREAARAFGGFMYS